MPPASVPLSKRAQLTLASLRKRDAYYSPNRTVIIAIVVVVVLLKLAIIFALFVRHQRRQERKRENSRHIMAQRRQEMRGNAWGGNMGTTRELRWADYDASRNVGNAGRREEMSGNAWGENMGTTRELSWADYDASRKVGDAGRRDRAQGPDAQMDRRDVDAEIVAAPPPYDHTGLSAQEQKRGQIQKPEPAKVDERGDV